MDDHDQYGDCVLLLDMYLLRFLLLVSKGCFCCLSLVEIKM